MIIETNRLLLRPWHETDAESVYTYAKNPEIGPLAGWPVHTSIENSRQIICDVLATNESYAVTCKPLDTAIGCVGLKIGDKSNLNIPANEAEIGYWLGQPFWGQGIIPEAVDALMHHAFEQLGLTTLWCGYFDGNEKSKRVQEKCGFHFHHTEANKYFPLINTVKTLHVNRLTLQDWRQK